MCTGRPRAGLQIVAHNSVAVVIAGILGGVALAASAHAHAQTAAATAGLFQTSLLNQSTGCFDPNPPSFSCTAFYAVRSRGIEYPFRLEPVALLDQSDDCRSTFFRLHWFGVCQDPRLSGVSSIEYSNGVVAIPEHFFPQPEGLFREASWFSVLPGQGHVPTDSNPRIEREDERENARLMHSARATIGAAVTTLPTHAAALQHVLCGE